MSEALLTTRSDSDDRYGTPQPCIVEFTNSVSLNIRPDTGCETEEFPTASVSQRVVRTCKCVCAYMVQV